MTQPAPVPPSDFLRRFICDPAITTFPCTDIPKELVLARMGIITPGAIDGLDKVRLEKLIQTTEELHARRNDPDYWMIPQLDTMVLLVNDVIDVDGNFLSDEIEVEPLLRKDLRSGDERQLWDDVAGWWLYPNSQKPCPAILTKPEAEFLQIACHWIDPNPRRPRPFFWAIQDMVWDVFKGSPPLVEKRIRQLARHIHEHRTEEPDHTALSRL